MANDDGPLEYRVWCGGLFNDITNEEVERKFEKFGKILHVRVRSSARDTFAFVQFENDEAVDAAIEAMDGNTSMGNSVKVQRATKDRKPERPKPAPRNDSREPPPRSYGRGRDRGRGRGRSDSRGSTPPRRGRDDRRGRSDSRNRGRGRSPPRYQGGGRSGGRARSRSERLGDGVVRMAGKLPVGRYKVTVEHLPEDMTWMELKDLAHDFGPSLTFARTYRARGTYCGMIEFKEYEDAERVVKELDHRRVQGCSHRLKAFHGGDEAGQ